MSTKNFVPTRKEHWGSFVQEKRILLPLVVGLLIGVVGYFHYDVEPDKLKMIPVAVMVWVVLIFLAIAPLLRRAGEALEKRGISERYERFVKECGHLLATETFDELCPAILAIVDNPAYPPDFYEDPSFWRKIFGHNLLENLDVGACSRLLRSVKLPELTQVAWTVMIERLVKQKGIFYFHENAQTWIDLSLRLENHGLEGFRQILVRLHEFPTTLSGCLNFDLQNETFLNFFDMHWFVPLINTQILEKFPPEQYFTLDIADKMRHGMAFGTLDRVTRKRFVSENKSIFLSAPVRAIVDQETFSPYDETALKEFLVQKVLRGNIESLLDHPN